MIIIQRKCPKCGNSYTCGKANSILHVFTKYPGMSYLESICNCEEGELWFPMLHGYKLSDLTHTGEGDKRKEREWQDTTVLTNPMPPDFELYYGTVKADPVAPTKLTPRLESEVERFAKLLNSVPDEHSDHLFDAITAPGTTPKMPTKWTDRG